MSAKSCHRERSNSNYNRANSNTRNKRNYNQARYHQLLRADSDEVDFDSLLKVVNELSNMMNEDGKLNDNRDSKRKNTKLNKKCIETAVGRYNESFFRGNSSRPSELSETASSRITTGSSRASTRFSCTPQLFTNPPEEFPAGRKNMSFSNEEVRTIDRENKRLLSEIINKKPTTSCRTNNQKQSPSAINRLKRQKEIERENLRFLQKLQSVKPTKTISRDYLLADHQRIQKQTSRRPRSSSSTKPNKKNEPSPPPSPSY